MAASSNRTPAAGRRRSSVGARPVTEATVLLDLPLEAAIVQHVRWLELRGLSPATVYQRQRVLARLRTHLAGQGEHLDVLTSTTDQLMGFMERTHLLPESRAAEVSHLRGFYAWALEWGLLEADPAAVLPRPVVRRRLPRPIDSDTLTDAIAHAPERVRPMLFLAAYAGLRASEIAALRREEVKDRHDPPLIVVIHGKGERQRAVPMADVLVAELRRWPTPARGWMFTRRDGQAGHIPGYYVSQLANRYLHSVGVAESLHSLRHWFGTEMYARTSDLRLVQELLGHESPNTTAGYAAWSPEKAAAAVKGLVAERPRPRLARAVAE